MSKAKSLFNIQHYHNDTNHKLEKVLETKVIMNQIKSKIDTCNADESIFTYMNNQSSKLKESYPMFFHCNKDIIIKCLVMLLRGIEIDLNNYETFYDKFY